MIIIPQTCGWIYFHICQITISAHKSIKLNIDVQNDFEALSLDKSRAVDLPNSPPSWPFDNHIFFRPGNVVCISRFVVLYLTLFVEGKYLERARWEEWEKEENICNGIIDVVREGLNEKKKRFLSGNARKKTFFPLVGEVGCVT